MNSRKPKGKVPSLIGSTLGTPKKVRVAKCSCNRCHCEIVNGTECYEIPQLGGSFSNRKRYCNDCFRSIIAKTSDRLKYLSC